VKEIEKQTNIWLQYVKSNLINGLFIIALLILIFNPGAKALIIKGLMQVGFFRPDIDNAKENHETAADATFTNLSGTDINLSSLKGKVVFLNFWAAWCPPCIAEMPGINELHKEFIHRADVVFVMVDADKDLHKSASFMKTHGYNLPLYASASASGLFTGTLPSTVLIDKKGEIVFRKTGAANYNTRQFKDLINKLAVE